MQEITSKYDVLELKEMIKEHVALTNSAKGKRILDQFSEYLPKFKKIIPFDYNRMLMTIVQMEEKGLNAEQAQDVYKRQVISLARNCFFNHWCKIFIFPDMHHFRIRHNGGSKYTV